MLSHLVGFGTSFITRLSSLFGSRKPLEASQSESEYQMGAFPKGVNRYNPLRETAGDQDAIHRAEIAHVSRGESFGDGDSYQITVDKTVQVV